MYCGRISVSSIELFVSAEPKKRRTFVPCQRKSSKSTMASLRKYGNSRAMRTRSAKFFFGEKILISKKSSKLPGTHRVRSGRSLYRTAVHTQAAGTSRRMAHHRGQGGVDGTFWWNGQFACRERERLHLGRLYSALQNNLLDINMLKIENLAKSSPNPRPCKSCRSVFSIFATLSPVFARLSV